jgi:hypothetical protein
MAISKPTKLPEWASTTANVVEPSEGKKDDGWLVNEIPPSSYENWRAKTNWQWWQWWDEKISEGATDENIQINGAVSIITGPLALTNVTALTAFAKGTFPGVVGTSGDPDFDETDQKVGVMGLAGTGTTSGAFTDVGVLGSDDAMTVGASNVGVVGHSTTVMGVLGIVANANITSATITNVGVFGSDSNFTGTVGNFGVFGYSDNKSGVLGIGGTGSLGSATISDCGVVGVGDNTIPSGSYSDIGVFGCGTWGGRFLGAGSSDIGVAGKGGAGTVGGVGGDFNGGSSTSGVGGKGIDTDGGNSTSGNGGVGIDATGGQGSSGNTSGNGVEGTGGNLSGSTSGDGGYFLGGSASGTDSAGDGIYAKGGDSGASGLGGYGAVLEGSSITGVARSALRLMPQSTPPSGNAQPGDIYYSSTQNRLEFMDNTGSWRVITFT